MPKMLKRLLIAAGFSATGFAITISWYKISEKTEVESQNLKPIARLVSSVNDVQKKQVQKLIWQPAIDNEVLHVGEAIRTSPDAEARIEFIGTTAAIDLEPDSAIVLEESAVDFVKGNIFVKSGQGEGNSSLTLKSGDKNFSLGQSEVSFGKSKTGVLDLQVLKGNITGVDAKALAAGHIAILHPLPGEPVYLNTNEKEMAIFQWQPLPKGYQVVLESGLTRTDLLPVEKASSSGESGEMKANMKLGKIFYQLIARSNQVGQPELKSAIVRAQILAKIPPVPLSPENEMLLTINKNDPTVKLLWGNPAGFPKLILEVASSADLKQGKKTEFLENASEFTLPIEKSGTYFWRISGLLEGRKDTISSRVQSFKAKLLDQLLPPDLESPRDNEKIPFDKIKERGLALSWKTSSGAERYRVLVESANGKSIRGPASNEKVFEDEGKQLQTLVPGLKPGLYTWSVASVGRKNEISKFSEKHTFNVQSLPILKWADDKTNEDHFYMTLKPSIALKWEKGDPTATHWQLHIATEDKPIPFNKDLMQNEIIDLGVPHDGIYYAEVEALNAKGIVIARSLKREIKVISAPLLPAPLYAQSVPKEIEASGSGSASVQWQKVQGAKRYVLAIKSPDGKSAKEVNFETASADLKDLMPGQYRVTLRSVDQTGRKGPEGEERVLKVPSQSSMRAPKLKGVRVK